MSTQSATIVQRLWNCCNVLRGDGVSYSRCARPGPAGGGDCGWPAGSAGAVPRDSGGVGGV